ncbi:hypothetical protein AUJ68_06860 [Candidatus Woesearchaeota archaeon CG1_02_57_44]|nr:MAG: hypothetical protein AUJ68_06860 [Candidatus Woesearchaeota archaeon CG1_02_57_44]PIN67673.1 MAG: hypothetical protein COV94_06870 [Candidatus Woesearchaeota archaeon CG11_big_fil_rev_8_21_14_0_20_57_5]
MASSDLDAGHPDGQMRQPLTFDDVLRQYDGIELTEDEMARALRALSDPTDGPDASNLQALVELANEVTGDSPEDVARAIEVALSSDRPVALGQQMLLDQADSIMRSVYDQVVGNPRGIRGSISLASGRESRVGLKTVEYLVTTLTYGSAPFKIDALHLDLTVEEARTRARKRRDPVDGRFGYEAGNIKHALAFEVGPQLISLLPVIGRNAGVIVAGCERRWETGLRDYSQRPSLSDYLAEAVDYNRDPRQEHLEDKGYDPGIIPSELAQALRVVQQDVAQKINQQVLAIERNVH